MYMLEIFFLQIKCAVKAYVPRARQFGSKVEPTLVCWWEIYPPFHGLLLWFYTPFWMKTWRIYLWKLPLFQNMEKNIVTNVSFIVFTMQPFLVGREGQQFAAETWLPTKQSWPGVEVKVDYHCEGIVEISPFFSKSMEILFKKHPFLRNQWTMPRTKEHPVSPWKCRLAWAPILNWTAVTGVCSDTLVLCMRNKILVSIKNQNEYAWDMRCV